MSTGESCGRSLVAETPPALRSLHGEVRRLKAALDAERFDRNYLQDELARTNLKLDKLGKVIFKVIVKQTYYKQKRTLTISLTSISLLKFFLWTATSESSQSPISHSLPILYTYVSYIN